MSNYLRPSIPGATIFFTVSLRARGSDTLLREIHFVGASSSPGSHAICQKNLYAKVMWNAKSVAFGTDGFGSIIFAQKWISTRICSTVGWRLCINGLWASQNTGNSHPLRNYGKLRR